VSDGREEFGPYVVYERLGQGGMATVHRAEKRGVGFRRPVALKRLLPHVAADPDLVKLFVDEARLASHLRHANVAQTYELGKVGETFFIAMEYASGPTLTQVIRQCQKAAGEIPLPITVNILGQLCEALDYAHNLCDDTGQALRIIHRDVSPANIIVTNTGIVKLIDFGIAKTALSSVKTQTGFIKGKFGYIAPEYISGKIDARVDLFAIGVIAHELLSGRRLFEGKDDFETLANIRELDMKPPSRWNPHVPPDLDDIVMTALARDPDQRWQSAAAMQVALANAARDLGVPVGSVQLVEWIEWAFAQVAREDGPVRRAAPEAETFAPGRGRDDSRSFVLRADSEDGDPETGVTSALRGARIPSGRDFVLSLRPRAATPSDVQTLQLRGRPAATRPPTEDEDLLEDAETRALVVGDVGTTTGMTTNVLDDVVPPPPPVAARPARAARTIDATIDQTIDATIEVSIVRTIDASESVEIALTPTPVPITPPPTPTPTPTPSRPALPFSLPTPRGVEAVDGEAVPPTVFPEASITPPPITPPPITPPPITPPPAVEPGPITEAKPRPRRTALLVLLMIVLGAGAMAIAYFWPDLQALLAR
jgi:serine/threonine protein kinase